jgi:hypothetical protein
MMALQPEPMNIRCYKLSLFCPVVLISLGRQHLALEPMGVDGFVSFGKGVFLFLLVTMRHVILGV